MDNSVQRPKWKKVEYTRSQIIKAGKNIKKTTITFGEAVEAIKIIDNWRASHAFPLHVIYMHLRRMANTSERIIVAERLKRLDSIINKLKREPTMNLWTMQDLGGCRLIVPTVDDVYKYANKYETSRKRHKLKKTYDYIKNPKISGYRSLHVVYEYKSDFVNTYNKNMLIEIQIRTRLQHLWATAVETYGLFTKEAIKSGRGSDDVKRFFTLVSALFAKQENQPLPPNVSYNTDDIVNELKTINNTNNYLRFLSGLRVAIDYQQQIKKDKKAKYYILILNYTKSRLKIKTYNTSQFEEANDIYNHIESTKAKDKVDAVLVNVSSFSDLKSAYPNYFSDIGEFIEIINSYLDGKR